METENIAQWHPAFCSAVELELRENKKILTFEREHNLGKLPLRIDLLIIKKKPDETITNEIGDFFRGSNIVEFKSPDDSINTGTFFKVLSYACLYRAENGGSDEIQNTDITISLIREGKPLKLLKQLGENFSVSCKSSGIYRVDKMLFPLQIIVTRELDRDSHIWLSALTRSLTPADAKLLIHHIENLNDEKDRLHGMAVMDFVSDENELVFKQLLKEGSIMTEELKQMIAPELAGLRILISNKDAELASKDAQIAERDARLADKDASLADKDAQIALLKKQLSEATKQK